MTERSEKQTNRNIEDRFTLDRPNLNIIADYLAAKFDQKLYIVDEKRIREEAVDPAECTHELLLNNSSPPEVCYKLLEKGVPRIRLLDDFDVMFRLQPRSGTPNSMRFKLTEQSSRALEIFCEKVREANVQRRQSDRSAVHERIRTILNIDHKKEAVVRQLLDSYSLTQGIYKILGYDVSTMPSENKIRKGVLKLPDAVFDAISLDMIKKPFLVICPPGGRKVKIDALNKYENREFIYFEEIDNDELWGEDNGEEWEVGITEGENNLEKDPEVHTDQDLKYYQQAEAYIEKWKKYGFDVMEGADKYLTLASVRFVEDGMRLDDGRDDGFTALNVKKLTAPTTISSQVAIARRLRFSKTESFTPLYDDYFYDHLRCRPWVKVDIT